MLVVETKATGKEILERSKFVGLLTVWLRVGSGETGSLSLGASGLLIRLVTARAIDMVKDY